MIPYKLRSYFGSKCMANLRISKSEQSHFWYVSFLQPEKCQPAGGLQPSSLQYLSLLPGYMATRSPCRQYGAVCLVPSPQRRGWLWHVEWAMCWDGHCLQRHAPATPPGALDRGSPCRLSNLRNECPLFLECPCPIPSLRCSHVACWI